MSPKATVIIEPQDSGKFCFRSGCLALVGYLFLRIDLLALLSSLLLGTHLASIALARLSLRNLSIQISTSQSRTRSGDPVKASVTLANNSKILPVFYPVLSLRESDTVRVQVYQYPGIVPPRSSRQFIVDPSLTQRGSRYLELFAPRSRFPFALHEATAELSACSQNIIVWPRPTFVDLDKALREPPRLHYDNPGKHLKLINNIDAERIRDYLPGDPRTQINWKLSAKRDKVTIIEPRDEPQERYELFLSSSQTLWQSELSFERMLSLVSSLVLQLSRRSLLQSITIDNDRYPLLTQPDSLRFFDALALLSPNKIDPTVEFIPKRNHLWILPAADGSGSIQLSPEPIKNREGAYR